MRRAWFNHHSRNTRVPVPRRLRLGHGRCDGSGQGTARTGAAVCALRSATSAVAEASPTRLKGTRDETRTRIALSCWRILSPLCLPIPPPGQCTTTAPPRHAVVVAAGATPLGGETVEPNEVADVLLHGVTRSAVTFRARARRRQLLTARNTCRMRSTDAPNVCFSTCTIGFVSCCATTVYE